MYQLVVSQFWDTCSIIVLNVLVLSIFSRSAQLKLKKIVGEKEEIFSPPASWLCQLWQKGTLACCLAARSLQSSHLECWAWQITVKHRRTKGLIVSFLKWVVEIFSLSFYRSLRKDLNFLLLGMRFGFYSAPSHWRCYSHDSSFSFILLLCLFFYWAFQCVNSLLSWC